MCKIFISFHLLKLGFLVVSLCIHLFKCNWIQLLWRLRHLLLYMYCMCLNAFLQLILPLYLHSNSSAVHSGFINQTLSLLSKWTTLRHISFGIASVFLKWCSMNYFHFSYIYPCRVAVLLSQNIRFSHLTVIYFKFIFEHYRIFFPPIIWKYCTCKGDFPL